MSVFDDLRVRLRNYSFTRTALTKGVWINDPVSDIDWHCNKHSWDSFCVCVYFKPLTDNVITHSIHIRPRWVTTWWVNIIITSSFWNAVPRFLIERTVSRSLLKVSGLVCKLFLYTVIQLYDVIICLINVQLTQHLVDYQDCFVMNFDYNMVKISVTGFFALQPVVTINTWFYNVE